MLLVCPVIVAITTITTKSLYVPIQGTSKTAMTDYIVLYMAGTLPKHYKHMKILVMA